MIYNRVPYCSSLGGHYTLRAMHTVCGRHSGLETGDKGCVWMKIGLVYTACAFALHKCYVHTTVIACKHAEEITSLSPH